MKTFKSLVPPWDLCKQIPDKKNNFRDSFFAWVPRFRKEGNHRIIYAYELYLRPAYNDSQCIPAPTLEEILAAIADYEDTLSVHIDLLEGNFWQVEWAYCNIYCDYSRESKTEIDKSAATAALKLWLMLEAEK